jgi:hypothetical protein
LHLSFAGAQAPTKPKPDVGDTYVTTVTPPLAFIAG